MTFRQLLVRTGMEMHTLDRRCGKAPGYTSQVLCGRVRMTFHHLFKWLEAMDVAPDEFFQLLAENLRPSYQPSYRPPYRPDLPPPDPEELDELIGRIAKQLMNRKKGSPQRPAGEKPKTD